MEIEQEWEKRWLVQALNRPWEGSSSVDPGFLALVRGSFPNSTPPRSPDYESSQASSVWDHPKGSASLAHLFAKEKGSQSVVCRWGSRAAARPGWLREHTRDMHPLGTPKRLCQGDDTGLQEWSSNLKLFNNTDDYGKLGMANGLTVFLQGRVWQE